MRRMQWEAVLASTGLVASRGIEGLRQTEDLAWQSWPTADELAYVAEGAAQRPLGAIMLKVHERDSLRIVGYRFAIGVEEDVRGQGIGRLLIEHAKRHVEASGADYLLLFVDTGNERAQRAYRATGFTVGDQQGLIPMIVRFDGRSSIAD